MTLQLARVFEAAIGRTRKNGAFCGRYSGQTSTRTAGPSCGATETPPAKAWSGKASQPYPVGP